jgi:hypothetical protein
MRPPSDDQRTVVALDEKKVLSKLAITGAGALALAMMNGTVSPAIAIALASGLGSFSNLRRRQHGKCSTRLWPPLPTRDSRSGFPSPFRLWDRGEGRDLNALG